MTFYAIGDIHGHLDKLHAAHALIADDRRRTGTDAAPVVHLGDLVDRGPDSAGVLGYLNGKCRSDARMVVLKGNHDRLLEWFLRPVPGIDTRMRPGMTYLNPSVGGDATLASYGVDTDAPVTDIHAEARLKVPQSDIAFLQGLPLTHTVDNALCVHAGLRPGVPLDAQAEDDLVWIRAEFHDDPRDHGALVVHGHTPVEHPELFANRLNIDTGAAYGGPLCTVVVEGRTAFRLTATGRQPIPRIDR
jgi:serine/threonine protein phosphatase 1